MLEPDDAIAALHEAMPDEQLMLAYADGDSVAFDTLYSRHEGSLYRFVRRLLGTRLAGEVDEVFQETWLRIIAARESFSPQVAAWRAWAFTIALQLAMDRLRVTGREVAFYAHDEDGDGPQAMHLFHRMKISGEGAEPSAEEVAFWRAAGRRLLACLEELPHEQRAAFLLHNEEGFGVEAMARALQINFETVRNRLRYGLRKLHACMERYLQVLERRA